MSENAGTVKRVVAFPGVNLPRESEQKRVDLVDGYTRIANELLEAMARSQLSGREFRVVVAVMRKTYGFQKKADFIALEQLSELTGISKSHICETIAKLVRSKVLTKTSGSNVSLIGVNTAISEWDFTQKTEKNSVPENGKKIPENGKKIPENGKKIPENGNHKRKKERKKDINKNTCANVADDIDANGSTETWISRKGKKISGTKLDAFRRFWLAFDYKKDRAKALDAFFESIPFSSDRALNIELLERVVSGASTEAKQRPLLTARGKTAIFAEGWLRGRRWEDEDTSELSNAARQSTFGQGRLASPIERRLAEQAARAHESEDDRTTVEQDDFHVRPSLDGEFWREH